MANTFTVDNVNQGVHQRLGMKEMMFVRGTISDIDAIARAGAAVRSAL